jgi:glyoxylase-like metal-dependent hydrolase (beta-lactamase superfamily II)
MIQSISRSIINRSFAYWAALFCLAAIATVQQQLPLRMAGVECFPLRPIHNARKPLIARRARSRRRNSLSGFYAAGAGDADFDFDDDDSNSESSFDWSTAIQNRGVDTANDNAMDVGSSYDDKQREAENIYIPKGGISVSDEIEASQRDKFQTEVVPIKGLALGVHIAQLVTTSMTRDSFEPVRYLVALSAAVPASSSPKMTEKSLVDVDDDDKATTTSTTTTTVQSETLFVMVDVPPYSPRLVAQMQAYMKDSCNNNGNNNNCRLAAILITSRDAIHYDEAPGAFAVRRSHVALWKQAFPEVQIVAYRLDIPRDCRAAVTQVLDGQGPFGAGNATAISSLNASSNIELSFVEMGRPLTYEAWDYQTAQQVLRGEKPPPDDTVDDNLDQVVENGTVVTATSHDEYSFEAIRMREAERSVLAVFTPGRTFGSLSFVFPRLNVCCSGFCIPVEDNRAQDEDVGDGGNAGPALDVRGYITTSRAGISRQMESAKKLVKTYSDRFHTVLPSRGDPLFLDEDDVQERQAELLAIIQQYKRIGEIYDKLGITSSKEEEKDDDNQDRR